MTMTPQQVEQLEAHLERVVRETVNGKIDALSQDFKKHQVKMQPILDAYTTANSMGNFVVWFAKVVIAIGIIGAAVMAFRKLGL